MPIPAVINRGQCTTWTVYQNHIETNIPTVGRFSAVFLKVWGGDKFKHNCTFILFYCALCFFMLFFILYKI